MSVKEFGVLIICVLFAISLCIGCSNEKEQKSISKGKDIHGLYEKVAKEKEKTLKETKNKGVDESKREKEVAVADACAEQYNSCLEQCKSNSCENACRNALSVCEKDLPSDLKTIKD